MARWSASAGRVCRIWGARAAATSSCISTSLCPGRSRRSSAGCTSSCATSRLRRRKTPKIPISSDASKTRWVGTSALHWLELAVRTHAEAVEAASEILSRVGHSGIAVEVPLEPRGGTDHTVKAYITLDADAYAKVSDIRDALGHLQAFGLGPIGELAVHEVRDEDWLESWKASFTPIRVGDFLIRPTWSEAAPDGATEIVLDPGMAFGTGLHPTTRQCLEAIGALAIDSRRVLDVGTGSGILAIAAAKRGAREVIGVDTDQLAVDAAVENAERNGVRVAVRRGSAADVSETFDVVVANIIGPILVRIAADLRDRLDEHGVLVAAGITVQAEADVVAAFAANGMRVTAREERADWVRLILAR